MLPNVTTQDFQLKPRFFTEKTISEGGVRRCDLKHAIELSINLMVKGPTIVDLGERPHKMVSLPVSKSNYMLRFD
jgi:hypothetical protein